MGKLATYNRFMKASEKKKSLNETKILRGTTPQEDEVMHKLLKALLIDADFNGKFNKFDMLAYALVYIDDYLNDKAVVVSDEAPSYEPQTWDYPGSDEPGVLYIETPWYIGIKKAVADKINEKQLTDEIDAETSALLESSVVYKNKIEDLNAACNDNEYYKMCMVFSATVIYEEFSEREEDGYNVWRDNLEMTESSLDFYAVRGADLVEFVRTSEKEDDFIDDLYDDMKSEFDYEKF